MKSSSKGVFDKKNETKEANKLRLHITPERRISFLRYGICICFVVAAVLCGFFSYTLLYNQETNLLNQQYDSLVADLQQSETNSINAQIQSMKLMSIYFQSQCPSINHWPNCSVPLQTFDNMTYALLPMTHSRSLTMAPLVLASQAVDFQTFALNFYKQQGYPHLGTTKNNVTGIYAKDSNGVPYNDLTVMPPSSKYPILAPVFIIGQLKYNSAVALYNTYSETVRAASINYVLDCSYSTGGSCGSITDFIQLVQDGPTKRPAALLNYPVRALNQPEVIVGMMASVINWDTTLSNSLPSYVDGLVVVLDSGTQIYTYIISGEVAKLQGVGDLHDSKYSSYARTFIATPFAGAVVYTITTYPSTTFANQYHTNIPMIACIAVVCVLLFIAMIFFWYDFYVSRQATEKESIIASRRQFVNFISHEIRTPLNTISLGMKLLLSEMSNTVDTYYDLRDEVNVASASMLSTKVSLNVNMEDDMIKKLEDYLNVIKDVEESSYMAITILSDILNYDKLMQGQLNLEIEPFDVWDMIRSSSRAFIIQARQKGVTYDFNFQFDAVHSYLEFKVHSQVKSNVNMNRRQFFAGLSTRIGLKSISIPGKKRVMPLPLIKESSKNNMGSSINSASSKKNFGGISLENFRKPSVSSLPSFSSKDLAAKKSAVVTESQQQPRRASIGNLPTLVKFRSNKGLESEALSSGLSSPAGMSSKDDYFRPAENSDHTISDRELKNSLYSTNSSLSRSKKEALGAVLEEEPSEESIKEYLEIKNLLVMGDKIKISQVIRNLISNALKFTPPNGRVLISAEWDKDDKRFKDLDFVQNSTNGGTEETEEQNEEKDVEAAISPPPKKVSVSGQRVQSVSEKGSMSISKSAKSFFQHFSSAKAEVPKKKDNVVEHKNVGSVTIKVTDSGAGLSKQNLLQLFQEGVQFNASKLQAGGGSGLGLWISKGIVDLHYGLLSATSQGIGFGCTFIVR